MRNFIWVIFLSIASFMHAQKVGFSQVFMTPDSLDSKIHLTGVVSTGEGFVAFGDMFTRRVLQTGIWTKFDSTGIVVNTNFYVNTDTFPFYTFGTRTLFAKRDSFFTYLVSNGTRSNSHTSGDYEDGIIISLINTRGLDTTWFRFLEITPRNINSPYYLTDAFVLPDDGIAILLTDDLEGKVLIINKQGELTHSVNIGKSARGKFTCLTHTDSIFYVGGIRSLNNLSPPRHNAIIQKIDWNGLLLDEISTSDTIFRLSMYGIQVNDSNLISFGTTYFHKWQKPPFTYPLNGTQPMWVQVSFSDNSFSATAVDTLTPGMHMEEVETSLDGDHFFVGRSQKKYPSQNSDYFGYLAKVKPNGTPAWARNYTVSFETSTDTSCCFGFMFKGVEPLSDGGAVAVGQVFMRDHTQQNQLLRKKDIGWIVRVDSFGCVVPGCQNESPDDLDPNLPKARLLISPNPTSDVTYAHWLTEYPSQATFSLRDAQGRELRSWTSKQPEMTFIIPLEELASGVYYLSVLHHGKWLESKKIMKL